MGSRAGPRKKCNLVITFFAPVFLLFYLTPANNRSYASSHTYVRFRRLLASGRGYEFTGGDSGRGRRIELVGCGVYGRIECALEAVAEEKRLLMDRI